VGRADVWVFDADNTGDSLGGDPLTVLTMFGDTPRALTTSPDGQTVFAAVMHSGNQTTTLGENRIAKSGPVQSSDGVQQPDTGLIVQFDGSNWRDETGQTSDLNATSYDSLVRFSLPDYDVFVINASDSPMVVDQYSGVGTTLFNMISNPVTGTVYVSNSESNNLTRFEGEGNSSTTLRGDMLSEGWPWRNHWVWPFRAMVLPCMSQALAQTTLLFMTRPCLKTIALLSPKPRRLT